MDQFQIPKVKPPVKGTQTHTGLFQSSAYSDSGEGAWYIGQLMPNLHPEDSMAACSSDPVILAIITPYNG